MDEKVTKELFNAGMSQTKRIGFMEDEHGRVMEVALDFGYGKILSIYGYGIGDAELDQEFYLEATWLSGTELQNAEADYRWTRLLPAAACSGTQAGDVEFWTLFANLTSPVQDKE